MAKNLYLSLDSIDVKGKTATITVDEHAPNDTVILTRFHLRRVSEDRVEFRAESEKTGRVFALGGAPTLRGTLELLTEFINGNIVNPIQFAPDGLDDMGLWTALDSGLPVH